jgi:hypothetical protein
MTDKTRPHRGLWRIVQVSLLLLLLGLVRQWWRYSSTVEQGRRDLAAILAEIDEADPRWRWADIEADRPDLPDERNSLVVLAKMSRRLSAWAKASWNTKKVEPAPNHLMERATLDALREEQEDWPGLFTLARSLRDHPCGQARTILAVDVVATQAAHPEMCREAARLLSRDVAWHLEQGRTHDAVESIHALLHVGAAVGDDNWARSQVVRLDIQEMAVRATERLLALGEPGDADLARLAQHFDAEATEPILRIALRGERAACHELFENLHAGKLPLGEYVANFQSNWVAEWGVCMSRGAPTTEDVYRVALTYTPHLNGDHATYLRGANEAIRIAGLPVEQQPAALRELPRQFWGERLLDGQSYVLSEGLFWGPLVLINTGIRITTELRCIRAALAAERYRRERGKWPASLADLVPRYLSAVPLDPHTGKPLILKELPDGIAIYSTGPDGIDDGGVNLSGSAKAGPRANRHRPADLGVRLWSPPYRRLSPIPVTLPEPHP